MKTIGVLLLVGVLTMGIITVNAAASDAGPTLFTVATAGELTAYPESVPTNNRLADQLFYVIQLPGTKLVVVLRPIAAEEYGSYQVQAIGHQIIERQVLAAAIVLPLVTAADIAGISPDLVLFLEQQVNAISGFPVFSVPAP